MNHDGADVPEYEPAESQGLCGRCFRRVSVEDKQYPPTGLCAACRLKGQLSELGSELDRRRRRGE
jgi:hypothetical protein